ncbi:MAG: sulfotransferase, partial [Silicimonas sp.]|nr:sulfotransferase [Silicimonas sp.]
AHPYSMDLTELAHYALAYDRLMRHWSEVLGDRLVRVRYEDVVTDPEAEIRRLLERLDLLWDPACLEPDKSRRRINTMSVGQARKPISKSSVGRWERFAAELEPLTLVLERHGLVHGA